MLIATLKILGLIFMTGPLLFAWLYSLVGNGPGLTGFIKSKLKIPLLSCAGIYLLSLILEEVVIAATGPGFEALNCILAAVIIVAVNRSDWMTEKMSVALPALLGLLIIIVHAYSSQSGFNSGIYPFLGLTVHIISISIWSGGLLVLLASRIVGSHSVESFLNQLKYHFFQITLILLVILLISGAILMTGNVHDLAVTDFTLYGGYLQIKLYLVGILILFILFEIVRLKSLYLRVDEDGKPTLNTRGPLINGFKSVFLVLIIICSGALTRVEPPNVAPFINPQSWQLSVVGQDIRIDMQPVAGSTIDIRFEVFLPEQLMQLQPINIGFDLSLLDAEISTYTGEAIQVSQNSFQGEATISAPGNWQLDLNILMAGGSALTCTQSFLLPSQPLIEDIRTYLSFSAISYNTSNAITFFVGLGLVLIYTWIARRGFSKKHISSPLILTGLAGFVFGSYMVMSVILVKTYPSTYWKNPQAYSADTINQGEFKFIEHCSECHGETGAGDGVWAIDNRGRIPDLASAHMDVHTDGEVYWWIARGIPSLDMPPLANEISEMDIWNIIYYVRSLRHGVP